MMRLSILCEEGSRAAARYFNCTTSQSIVRIFWCD